ncbi:hypothetical protein EST38_g6237 [Candolleomyces aberdarensis]|uniref:Nephrocystin 3-like N-terminal domain-containing protein n=1 Tax=Candolleomyces aberdarensis TaxID=2316362 RepID=A0A4Q2DIJ5_9AGAR|nr:hypothetical protein EST38_g6237 [Candolleomyces aberdarensis]
MRDLNVMVPPTPNLEPVDGWKLLVENISPNALHNSYVRYDAPKCDEDTRVEVTSELMDRIGDRDSPQRLLCMTGAAGSGKSALQQTIAERCAGSGILGAAYFFSSGDPTRNTTSTVVPTIAFQLGSHNPDLKQRIGGVVAQDPVIFKRSLRTQMDSLIVGPLKHLQEYASLDLATLPHAILIDGLDECKGEERQEELLTALRECLVTNDLPFHIFIASRPEWAIRTALEPGGHLRAVAYHVQLNDDYDASEDMRRYLRRRFEQLSLRTGNPLWFTEDNIETLVKAASGQFIYVATVYRYISERRALPTGRLKIVLTWTPHEGQARPFEALDKLYTEILLNAKKEYEAVDTHRGRDFLLFLRIHHANCSGKLGFGMNRDPEAAAVISTFFNKWKRDSEEDFNRLLREDEKIHNGRKSDEGSQRSARQTGPTGEPMLAAPFEEGLIGQPPPLTNPDIGARPSQSFFEGAQHFQMRDFQHFNVNHVTVNPPNLEQVDGWKLLVENISPNALHNSYARYDAPKCDEDTRVEVTSELMDRIGDRDSPQRLLCMTGAAGSGKSALQQTIAERCAESGTLGSAYFFSSGDPTRNTTSTIVPTIAFQLGSHNPGVKKRISAVVAEDSVIFKRSLRTQMDSLLVLKHLQEHAELDLATLPHVILIDGLDECKGEERQQELLIAIRECLLTNDLPFHIFIASRPEWAIRTALEPGGHLRALAYHVQLNVDYDASPDTRRYLRRRFEQLSFRTGNPHWFTESNIETLVHAGSGQFIYVATVYRYISERRASPAERLKIVLTWTPHEAQIARPFEALDKLYTEILLNAKKKYEAVDTHCGRDFLLLLRVHQANCSSRLSIWVPWMNITKLLRMDKVSTEILISDLHSLALLRIGGDDDSSISSLPRLHKSFSDFLDAESRAKDLFVPLTHVHAHLTKCCLLHIIQSPQSDLLEAAARYFPIFWTKARAIDDEIVDFTQKGGWDKIDSLDAYYKEYYSSLSDAFGPLIEGLKSRHPEVVVVISTFFNKWKRDWEDWEHRLAGFT